MKVICIHDLGLNDYYNCDKIFIKCGSKFTITLLSDFDPSDDMKQELHGFFHPYLIGNKSYLKHEFVINSTLFNECFKEIN